MESRHGGVVSGQNNATMAAADVKHVKTDLKLLLQCLKCHMGNCEVQTGTLLTTADVCSSSDDAQEFFRECGGINFVLNILTSTEDVKLKIAALYMLGCACEKNVFSQKRLCTTAVFKFLYCQLISDGETSENLRRTSAFLLLCLVTNNGEGQNLARTSHCLEVLLKLFRTSYPTTQSSYGSRDEMWMDSDADHKRLELWTTVTSALCGCVNNPQNEENQHMCSSAAFPSAIKIMSKSRNPTVIRLLSSFLSLTIANNGSNQDRFSKLGGLETLVDLLHGIIEELLHQPDQDAMQAAVQLANVFVSCVTDCEYNHSRLVDLSLVPMLVQLLSMDVIESDIRLKIIITLGHLTEKCGRSQRQLLESDGLSLLVHIMADNQDEEFNKAAMYLLTSCVDLVSCIEEESLTAGNGLRTLTKPKSVDKRNKARVEREAAFNPICKQQPRTKDSPSDSTAKRYKNKQPDLERVADMPPAVTSTNTYSVSPSSRKMNETTEDKVINELLRQLHEEKSARERLENEKKALERLEDLRQRSKVEAKEMAEAIAVELERQCKEQEPVETSREIQEQQDVGQRPGSVSSNQVTSPAIKDVQQRLDALERSLSDISNMGNQLAEQIVQARQRDQPTNHQDAPISSTVDRFKTLSEFASLTTDNVRGNNPNRNEKLTSEQVYDRVEKYLRSLSGGTDNAVYESQVVETTAPLKPPHQPSQFRVPSHPVRRQQLEASGRIRTNQHLQLGPNVFRTQGCESGLRHTEPSDESYTESWLSDVTSESTVTDTEMSVTASDMSLLRQAQSTHRMPSAVKDPQATSARRHISSSQRRPSRSIRVNCSSQAGATFTFPASAQPSGPTRPGVSRLGVSKENTRESKDVHRVKGSQSENSGTSSLHGVSKCPGCAPPINRPLLNSRNFVYTLERSPHTCPGHRELHRHIKQDIRQRREAKSSDMSPASTRSARPHLVGSLGSGTRSSDGSPPSAASSVANNEDGQRGEEMSSGLRRQLRRTRHEFSQEEVRNLINGVARMGKHWNSILWAYKFAPGRTAVALKDKYRRMQTQNYPGVPQRSQSAKSSRRRRRNCKVRDPTWRP